MKQDTGLNLVADIGGPNARSALVKDASLGSNSPDFHNLIYMIQMSIFFSGVATLLQTISFGPVGAKLLIVQGTSFAFIPIMITIVAGKGVGAMAIVMCGVMVDGIFHASLAPFIGRIRFALPPLVTGLVVTMIGLTLVKVGIQYAAGVPAIGKPEYGSLQNWSVALACNSDNAWL